MKKILITLLALCMLSCAVSCGIDTDSPKKETADNSSAEVTEEVKDEVWGLNETAVFESLKVTALKLKESNGKSFFEPEKGNIFVGIKFEIENISAETQSISSLLLFDAYVDDVKCEYSISANMAFSEGTLDGSLTSGKKLIGWYSVEIPKNWKKLELEVKSEWLSSYKAIFAFEK